MKELKLLLITNLFSLTLSASDNCITLKQKLDQCSTAEDFKIIAMQQLGTINTLEYVNSELVETNDKLVKMLAESNELVREARQSLERFSGSVWVDPFRLIQFLKQKQIINTTLRLIDCGIAIGLSMQLYQWYGMH